MTRSSLLLALCAASAAAAQDPAPAPTAKPEPARPEAPMLDSGQAWSLIGAKTLPAGANALEVLAGYPGLFAGYQRGVTPTLTLGGRVGFAYGLEGLPRDLAPGFKLQAVGKLRLLDQGRFSLGVTFEPGAFFQSSPLQGLRTGVCLPVGFRFGIAASSALAVTVSVDFPMWVEFGQFGGFNLPILTGAGVEYFVTSNFLGFARVRLGPTVRTSRLAELTLDAFLGVGYRF